MKDNVKKVNIKEKIAKDKKDRQARIEAQEVKSKYKTLLVENEYLSRELDASLEIKKNLSPSFFHLASSSKDSEATAVVLASDWHIEEDVDGKTINNLNNFNMKIAEQRVKQFFQSTLKLVKKEQQDVKLDTLVLALLGDFISGNIHEALLSLCETTPIDAMIIAENWIAGGINYLLKNSRLNLVIPCHMGNHPRITKKVIIAQENGNSMESFMYHHLASYFRSNKRVKFLISDSYLSYLKVYDFTICFQHGHAIRYAGGVGGLTIPLNKAVAAWQRSPTKADLYCLGHWHSYIDAGTAVVNGSLIGYNAFARFIKADFEKPKQMFFLIDKKRNCKTVTIPILFDV